VSAYLVIREHRVIHIPLLHVHPSVWSIRHAVNANFDLPRAVRGGLLPDSFHDGLHVDYAADDVRRSSEGDDPSARGDEWEEGVELEADGVRVIRRDRWSEMGVFPGLVRKSATDREFLPRPDVR